MQSALPELTKDTTIIGPGQNKLVIKAPAGARHFTVSGNADLTLSNVTLMGPDHPTDGQDNGGVKTYGGKLIMTNVTVKACKTSYPANNHYAYGGGVDAYGSVEITGCTFDGNVAEGSGGGVYAFGSANITNSAFTGNDGGGVSLEYYSAAITNCTFTGNSRHGGVHAYAPCTIVNSTFIGNDSGNGGGIFLGEGGTVALCTVVGNEATNNGGGISIVNNKTANLYGNIIAGNKAVGSGNNVYHSIVGAQKWVDDRYDQDDLYNIIGEPVGFRLTEVFGTASPALASNGGPTQTIALAPASAARDKIPAATLNSWGLLTQANQDQRGMTRPSNANADIGAYELQPPPTRRAASPPPPATVR